MAAEIKDAYWISYRHAKAKGDFHTAYLIARSCADFYESRCDFRQMGKWLRHASVCLYRQGRYSEAIIEAARAADIQPDIDERIRSLVILAGSSLSSFDNNAAFYTLGKAEELCRSSRSSKEAQADLYGCRGLLFLKAGDVDQGVYNFKIAGDLMQERGDFQMASLTFNNLGHLLCLNQRPKEAEEALISAITFLHKVMNPHIQAGIYDSLGHVYMTLDRYDEAESLLEQSARIFNRISDKPQLIGSLLHLSELHERMHKYRSAHSEAERALKLSIEIKSDLKSDAFFAEARSRLLNLDPIISRLAGRPCLFHQIYYSSSVMQTVITRLRTMAATDETILIQGETGTGKELVALAIHQESKRRDGPFIPFNCSALSRELIESRLFGHRKGAFTGADREQHGVIREAQGGTLFLDEIGDLSLEAQGALLRFLQSGEIQPVGAARPIKVNVRVVAATHRELRHEVESGRFRSDLFYRLYVASLWLPPLRARAEDIAGLARHFVRKYGEQYGLTEFAMSEDEIARLGEYDWPGNVRELENYIKRRLLFGPDEMMSLYQQHASEYPRNEALDDAHNKRSKSWRRLSQSEKQRLLSETLEMEGGNIAATARYLGISRRAVYDLRQRMDTPKD